MFEIGDQVTWKVGNMTCKGCVLSDNNSDTVEVQCRLINNKPKLRIVFVKRELLK